MIYGLCTKCGKKGWFIRHRQYLVPKVSPRPITSAEKMCNKCAKGLQEKIKTINNTK